MLKRRQVTKQDMIGAFFFAIWMATFSYFWNDDSLVLALVAGVITGALYFVIGLYLPVKRKS